MLVRRWNILRLVHRARCPEWTNILFQMHISRMSQVSHWDTFGLNRVLPPLVVNAVTLHVTYAIRHGQIYVGALEG